MTLEVKVGPPQLAVHQGHYVMVGDPDGQILTEGDRGLYFKDTSLMSSWALFANGQPWTLLDGGALTASAARVYCTNLAIATSEGIIAEKTPGLVFSRHIDGSMHEDFDIKPVTGNAKTPSGACRRRTDRRSRDARCHRFQCETSEQHPGRARSSRVIPPITHSRRRLCP